MHARFARTTKWEHTFEIRIPECAGAQFDIRRHCWKAHFSVDIIHPYHADINVYTNESVNMCRNGCERLVSSLARVCVRVKRALALMTNIRHTDTHTMRRLNFDGGANSE